MDIKKTTEELIESKKLFSKIKKNVTIFGSARVKEGTELWDLTYSVARMFSDNGYNIITGGGPGIMQAASHGGHDGKSKSVGLNIDLPNEQNINPYLEEEMTFEHFQTRKAMLINNADGFVVFPGGYGTLDELMEVLTLIQTGKLKRVPIYLMGKSFWENQLRQFDVQADGGYISRIDMDLYKVFDSKEELERELVGATNKNKKTVKPKSEINMDFGFDLAYA